MQFFFKNNRNTCVAVIRNSHQQISASALSPLEKTKKIDPDLV